MKPLRDYFNGCCLGVGLAVCCGMATSVSADCGSIPFSAPLSAPGTIVLDLLDSKDYDVKVNPLNVVVYEPGQRAIVLWNGVEEILLLSTEIRTSKPTSILEVIPMPAEPEVKLGNFESFEKMQKLLVEKTMWKVASGGGIPGIKAPENAGKITFHERMGAHDLAVVEVLDSAYFSEWVLEFLAKKGATQADMPDEFLTIIDNYLDRGFKWFVFDVIETSDKVQSRQPVQYRFKTDSLFYPLEISTLEKGKTSIDLLLVTQTELSDYPVVKASMRRDDAFTASLTDIQDVSPEWAQLMASPSVTIQRVGIKGKLGKMKTDFVAR